MSSSQSKSLTESIVREVGRVLIGKESQIKLALTCLLAGGHLLIEDLPGMGKTTLVQALAKVLNLSFSRIQFTSDLLPGDILGVSVFDRNSSAFEFHPGPVFKQLVLADEINRTTPKTQSALLEAMSEGQVTTEGETRVLPQPFFVVATQNPSNQSGTFPLPESQLDRFLMRLSLGYPDPGSEREILAGGDPRRYLNDLKPVVDASRLLEMQQSVSSVRVSDSLVDYVQRLVSYTRDNSAVQCGLSPRGALALLHCARAWAMIEQRTYVIPEDIQAVMPAVAAHRLVGAGEFATVSGEDLVGKILEAVDTI